MEKLSTDGLLSQKAGYGICDVFFVVSSLNSLLKNQSSCQWFEIPLTNPSYWQNVIQIISKIISESPIGAVLNLKSDFRLISSLIA